MKRIRLQGEELAAIRMLAKDVRTLADHTNAVAAQAASVGVEANDLATLVSLLGRVSSTGIQSLPLLIELEIAASSERTSATWQSRQDMTAGDREVGNVGRL